MLAFGEDFHLWVIRAEVAITATFRLTRNRRRKSVATVTDGAGPLAAIGIQASDAFIGPGERIQFAAGQHFHPAAVAFLTAADRCRGAFDNITQYVIQ